MTEFFQNLLLIMTPAILAIVGYVAVQLELMFKRRTGLQIEGYHRDALHLALETGARLAISKAAIRGRGDGDVLWIDDDEPTIDDLKAQVVAYAQRSVPDAINFLKAEFDQLLDMASAKLDEKMSS
jgi:hypothetical protein